MNKTFIKGIFYGIVAGVSYGMNPTFTLPLYQEGLNADSVLVYRYGFGALFLALWLMARGVSFRIQRSEILAVILAGWCMAACSLFLFLSYNYMAAGVASTILFIYPVIVALIMALFFREKIRLMTVASLLLSLLGVVVLYHGGDGVTLSLTGTLLVLISAIGYAVYIVVVRESRLKNMRTDVLTFYAVLAGVPLFLTRMNFGLDLQPITTAKGWACALALGLVPTMISLAATAKAIRYAGATPTAILGALEPATAIFFGVVFFQEGLTIRLICGLLLIVAAVLLIILGNVIEKRNATEQ